LNITFLDYGTEVLATARAGDFGSLQTKLDDILASEKVRQHLKDVVNIQDYRGKTALHYACESVEGENCITILLTYKANVDIQDDDKNTVFDIARTRPNRDAILNILKYYRKCCIFFFQLSSSLF